MQRQLPVVNTAIESPLESVKVFVELMKDKIKIGEGELRNGMTG